MLDNEPNADPEYLAHALTDMHSLLHHIDAQDAAIQQIAQELQKLADYRNRRWDDAAACGCEGCSFDEDDVASIEMSLDDLLTRMRLGGLIAEVPTC